MAVIPSLERLKAETARLRSARTREEIAQIQAEIRNIHEDVVAESQALREHYLSQYPAGPVPSVGLGVAVPEQLECPKCHRRWTRGTENYSSRKKGKRREKTPWCPHCNLEVYPEGDERLKQTIIPRGKSLGGTVQQAR